MKTSHSPSQPQGGCGLRPFAASAWGALVPMPRCQDAVGLYRRLEAGWRTRVPQGRAGLNASARRPKTLIHGFSGVPLAMPPNGSPPEIWPRMAMAGSRFATVVK